MTTAASAPAAAIAAVIWMVARVDSHPDPASTSLSVKGKDLISAKFFLEYLLFLTKNLNLSFFRNFSFGLTSSLLFYRTNHFYPFLGREVAVLPIAALQI
jgi:hypothetical protein